MQFGVEYYRKYAMEQTLFFQHSALHLFGSINMASIYPRFEHTFKTSNTSIAINNASTTASTTAAASQKKNILSTPSSVSTGAGGTGIGIESSASDAEAASILDKDSKEQSKVLVVSLSRKERQGPMETSTYQERKAPSYLNFVMLPFDSTLISGAPSTISSTTLSNKGGSVKSNTAPTSISASHSSKNSHDNSNSSPASSLMASIMSNLSISFNRPDILSASFMDPSQDVFGIIIHDQERWKVWSKGLRNKILSLSMRPHGGPALGPRNRPGIVSEREWLRYASWTWDTIRKADFLSEYARAVKLSREG
ncbi:hypothetical protein BCR41DRAFT_107640 [Lobosporangium transversale]|uniref:Uncharacterized protein n=1 Tax=Lobosporangium transversale TaxID=64571 RepID=A0A1Y2GHJ9_9FUNG|nr:hypothetical protein BCR41DRAFT_115488 [Lobosporangium transversale]XP_021879786.1 hypothetical protein BCR41DRAFT_107640 [Lobosporangium transversale]ORZ11006.1 hypothetical protein BCR41DRAFT_115488 [Lobosporangium transversale]ORZ11689.1 hypothetical protein BCR41DRAFT_107640 [Lobosporangium transversale]|eukprot:XP_021879523.1 hypothetical protein BCR41DRAFT_115488 [Lobosporangium transversale]